MINHQRELRRRISPSLSRATLFPSTRTRVSRARAASDGCLQTVDVHSRTPHVALTSRSTVVLLAHIRSRVARSGVSFLAGPSRVVAFFCQLHLFFCVPCPTVVRMCYRVRMKTCELCNENTHACKKLAKHVGMCHANCIASRWAKTTLRWSMATETVPTTRGD